MTEVITSQTISFSVFVGKRNPSTQIFDIDPIPLGETLVQRVLELKSQNYVTRTIPLTIKANDDELNQVLTVLLPAFSTKTGVDVTTLFPNEGKNALTFNTDYSDGYIGIVAVLVTYTRKAGGNQLPFNLYSCYSGCKPSVKGEYTSQDECKIGCFSKWACNGNYRCERSIDGTYPTEDDCLRFCTDPKCKPSCHPRNEICQNGSCQKTCDPPCDPRYAVCTRDVNNGKYSCKKNCNQECKDTEICLLQEDDTTYACITNNESTIQEYTSKILSKYYVFIGVVAFMILISFIMRRRNQKKK
jgi:hypothetical protein